MRWSAAFALLAALPAAAFAQGPEAHWRTLETDHFRIHYPHESEAWSKRMATRLEAVRRRVGDEIGYRTPDIVDIVVVDPVAQANGIAWPVLGRPRLVLYPTPPPPESPLAHFRDWTTTLLVHEQAHLAHLLRPSRNPVQRALATMVPVGPIPRRAPRWLVEGYATLVEGDVTGMGRPFGDLRDAVLRRFAQAGALPRYGALSGSDAWLGRAMPYLLGSAYLAWLRDRAGDDSLRDLWRRMSARRGRSFAEAFTGVFGDGPEVLYGRFCAELTYEAMRHEAVRGPGPRAETLWLERRWDTGDPAVSPAGDRLALVLRDRERPARLAVFDLADDPAEEAAREAARERLLARDPEDVPARRTEPPPRRPRATLGGDLDPRSPRWLDDSTILFVRYVDDGGGFRRPDLFSWSLAAETVTRLTRGADLRDPDPASDGTWAVAVRQRHGLSALVRVHLAGPLAGRVDALSPPGVAIAHAQPRIRPDGAALAWVEHRDGRWQLLVGDRDARDARSMALPAGAVVSHPAWAPDGGLFAAVASDGRVALWRFDVENGTGSLVGPSGGASLAPAPTPDGGALFFLSLEPRGFDVHRLVLGRPSPTAAPGGPAADAANTALAQGQGGTAKSPILGRPAPVDPPPLGELPAGADRAYRVGRLEWSPLVGGRWSGEDGSAAIGLRVGDVLGRFELLAQAEPNGGDFEGALSVAWRGPTGLGPGWSLEAMVADLENAGTGTRGVEVGARRTRTGTRHGLDFGASVWRGTLDLAAGDARATQSAAALRFAYRGRRAWGRLRAGLDAALAADAGETAGESWRRGRLLVGVDLARGKRQLAIVARVARAEDIAYPGDGLRLGGIARAVEPSIVLGGRIEVPALPDGAFVGDRYRGWRAELRPTSWPVTLFFERHRLTPGPDPLRLWGLELRYDAPRMPLLRLPAFTLWTGVAEILDPPYEGDVEGWLSLRWRP